MKRYDFSLETIKVSKIKHNPNNPRGPRVRDNDDQFDYLKRSIKEFGLIVPLIVQEINGDDKKYRLIDGERRYWALKALGIKNAASHVIHDEIDTDEVKNIMFHIHTNREQWDACQHCKALEPLYEQLKDDFEENENKIATELVKLTGTNKRTINGRLNFLRWSDEIKNMVYDKRPDLYWTIVEIEGGIIKPAEKNFPNYFKIVKKDEVRKLLLQKYIDGIVRAGTEVRKARYIVRTPKENIEQHKYAYTIFNKLVKEVDYTFEEAQEEFLAKFPEAEKMIKTSYKKFCNQLLKITTILKEYDISLFSEMVTETKKEELNEILQDLERALDDFRQNFQNLS